MKAREFRKDMTAAKDARVTQYKVKFIALLQAAAAAAPDTPTRSRRAIQKQICELPGFHWNQLDAETTVAWEAMQSAFAVDYVPPSKREPIAA